MERSTSDWRTSRTSASISATLRSPRSAPVSRLTASIATSATNSLPGSTLRVDALVTKAHIGSPSMVARTILVEDGSGAGWKR